MHNATVEIFDPGDVRASTTTRWSQLIADRIAFVPRYRQRVRWVPGHLANPVWVDDAALRPRLPRTPLGAAAPGHHRPAARAGRPDRLPAARPQPAAVGGLLRRGARGRPGRGALQGPPGAGGRRRRPSTSAQVLLDRTPERRELGGRRRGGRAVRSRRPACCSTRSATPSPTPYTALDTVRGATDSLVARRRRRDPRRRHGRQRARQPAVRAGHADRGDAVAAAPVRDRTTRARRAPHRARRPRRHRQRRHPGDRHRRRCAAWLMTRAESLGGLRQVRAVVPVSVHDARARGHLARAPRSPPHFVDLPGRRAEPGRPAAPGVVLVQGPQGDRPRGRRQPDRRHRRLRAVDVPRDRVAGGGRRAAARLPALGDQRARAAVAALRRRRA